MVMHQGYGYAVRDGYEFLQVLAGRKGGAGKLETSLGGSTVDRAEQTLHIL